MKNFFEEKEIYSNQLIKNKEEKLFNFGRAKSTFLNRNSENDKKKFTENKEFQMLKISCPPKKKKNKKLQSDDEEDEEEENKKKKKKKKDKKKNKRKK